MKGSQRPPAEHSKWPLPLQKPFVKLSLSLSHTQTHTHTHTHRPSVCLLLSVFITRAHTFLSSVFRSSAPARLFSSTSLSPHLYFSLSPAQTYCNLLSPLCLSRLMLYPHFPVAPTLFLFLLLSLLPSVPSLPVSTSLSFSLSLAHSLSTRQCPAWSLESAAKQRPFEKNGEGFPTSCVVYDLTRFQFGLVRSLYLLFKKRWNEIRRQKEEEKNTYLCMNAKWSNIKQTCDDRKGMLELNNKK